MASIPSASALSAVLRCRGTILTRNPPTKRPATSAYSLGLAGERTRSNQTSTWETFLRGERVLVGERLSVAYASSRLDDKILKKKDPLWQSRMFSPEEARSAAPGAKNALLVRQLARKLISNLPEKDKSSQLMRIIKYNAFAVQICKTVFVQDISELPDRLLKVSITFPNSIEKTGQIPSLVLNGWSTLRRTCLFLTTLVSEIMFNKLWRPSSSAHDATHPLICTQDVESIKNDVLQTNGHIPRSSDPSSSSSSRQKITEDRPD